MGLGAGATARSGTFTCPTLARAWQGGWPYAVAFLVGFYSLLVGGKIVVAAAVAGGRRFLSGPWYGRLLWLAGLLLCVLGGLLLWQFFAQFAVHDAPVALNAGVTL